MPEQSKHVVRVGVFGTYGFENMGDAAVADATIAGIRRHIRNAEILGICQQPEYVKARHGIDACSIFRDYLTESDYVWSEPGAVNGRAQDKLSVKEKIARILKSSAPLYRAAKTIQTLLQLFPAVGREIVFSFHVLGIVRRLDLIVMSGSGQLNEEWGGPWRYPFGLFRWCLLARLSGCRIAFLSVGAGEIFSGWTRFFCASALRLAHYRSVRDARTKELVESWRVGAVHLVPDMAFSMTFDVPGRAERHGDKPIVGINPIPYCNPRTWNIADQSQYDSYIDKLSTFCLQLLSGGHAVKFIPNDLVMDVMAIDDIISNLGPEYADHADVIRTRPENYIEVFQAFAVCDFVICTRFHGLLFSLMSGKPIVALAHHYKFFKLSEEMGVGRFCLDIADFSLDDLAGLFNEIKRDSRAISGTIADRTAQCARRVEDQYRLMKDLVMTSPPDSE